MPQATASDVTFFREYVGMSEEDKERTRKMLRLMFGARKEGEGEKS